MARDVLITGCGPVSGLGVGMAAHWEGLLEGRSALAPLERFDASGFDCRFGGELHGFKVNQYVPKSYRKATKVMARDIGLAIAGADSAARDAGLRTTGTTQERGEDFVPDHPPPRVGVHVGAGLIAADLDELTPALAEAMDEQGRFDLHRWGSEGMEHLTPLWLLKYLPNMLACHLTIIHDAQGPSNTITCAETSAALSVGESLRVIQRDNADLCFCGGAESKLNLMAFYRQHLTGRLNTADNERPAEAVRPFCATAAGSAVGEGGGILTLEARDRFESRASAPERPYCTVLGFGASQSVHVAKRNLVAEPEGRALAGAIERALAEAETDAASIDFVVPTGLGVAEEDAAELAALERVFGDRLSSIPLVAPKALTGNCLAGAGGIDLAIAAQALAAQTLPPTINRREPRAGAEAVLRDPCKTSLARGLVVNTGLGGQNAALVLGAV